ncbi:SDR family NAD(P)-dependent oxidoreductase [Niabella hirudinis]|uniref:SDR family NAD(P)-dependent oxidoreductase n=1 Tax=Niabella hirudinis TaxID=1285929 RepID=UPI003EBB05DA
MFQIDLSGKTVLVSGATSGIGRGIACQMAHAGARVSCCATTAEDLGLVAELESLGAEAIYIPCDVTKEEDLEQLVKKTVGAFGGIDILVSNAGQNVFTGAEKTTSEDWQFNLDLNLTAHWRLAKLCKPYLEQKSGVIIIMSSNHAFGSISGCFPYNLAKTALTGLVRSLATEWAPAIRTVGIAPGFIDTPGNQEWFNAFADAAAERERTVALHPVKRLGATDEIGGWCVFLASDYAAFASGTTYLVDGGRSALLQDD